MISLNLPIKGLKTVVNLVKLQCRTLAISSRQLFASFLICSMLLPILSLPVQGTVPYFSRMTADTPNSILGHLDARLRDSADRWLNLSKDTLFNYLGNSVSDDRAGSFGNKPRTSDESRDGVSPTTNIELLRKIRRVEIEIAKKGPFVVGDRIQLNAIPLDLSGDPVHGIVPDLMSENEEIAYIDEDRKIVAKRPGTVIVSALAGEQKASIELTVTNPPTNKRLLNRLESRKMPLSAISSFAGLAVSRDKWPAISSGGIKWKSNSGLTASPLTVEDPYDGWDDPSNDLGRPEGRTEPGANTPPAAIAGSETPGSSNFSFSVPLINLPGRGEDLSLALMYNSRVWHRRDEPNLVYPTQLEYGLNGGGFVLGFGKLEGPQYNPDCPSSPWPNQVSLIDPDGTRHDLNLKSTTSTNVVYETNNGSVIVKAGLGSETVAIFSTGTQVEYGYAADNNQYQSLPTKITDRNGNYILITYKTYVWPGTSQVTSTEDISTIQDTMGRYIRFHYDGDIQVGIPKLYAITAPGYGGGPDRQIARFYYQDYNLSLSFNSQAGVAATVGGWGYHNIPGSPNYRESVPVNGLKYIYFPGTNSGYKYDYSAYGMVYRTSQLRGMAISHSGLDLAGTVTSEGQTAATTLYDYPQNPSNLSDVPKYTRRTDDWAGRTLSESMPNGDAPYFLFDNNEDQGITTITAPDGTITETHSIVNPQPPGTSCNPSTSCDVSYCDLTPWNHGLINDIIVKKNGQILSKLHNEWEAGVVSPPTLGKGNTKPRIKWVETTNEIGQTRRTTYNYTAIYNNLSEVVEHDFSSPGTPGAVMRRTATEYETRSQWIDKGLRGLATKVQLFEGTSLVPISRTDFKYDTDTPGATLLSRSGILMSAAVNEYRGNVTSIKKYADAAAGTGDITDTINYDVAGNVIELTANCCRQKTTEFSLDYQYAYPTLETRGTSPQLSTSFTYDFNTGRPKTVTDENNQVTTNTYNHNSLRLTKTETSDGGWTEFEYQDQVPSFVKTTKKIDSSSTISNWSWENGRGTVYRSRTSTPEGYLSSDVEFNIMGRTKRSSNPYKVPGLNDPVPGNIKWTEVTAFDDLGRPTEVKLPDNTIKSTNYSGSVVTIVDEAGKKRRQVADALYRIVRVDEPDTSGQLDSAPNVPAQPTYYEYDGNNNLTKVIQTGHGVTQERKFKYDSLSRLVYEKKVEAVPTISDSGSNLWTNQYKYNSFGLLEEGLDARGVKANYEYDGLNRIKRIWYSGEVGYQTPEVTYTYGTNSALYNNGRLLKSETASVGDVPTTSQNYEYNLAGQVKKYIQAIGTSSYSTEYTYNLVGAPTSQKYPSGREVTYNTDNVGRLSSVSDSGRTYAGAFQYGQSEAASGMSFGNGTVANFARNDRQQITSQSLAKGNSILQRYDYSYGEINSTTGILDPTKNNGQVAQIESYIGGTTSNPTKQFTQKFVYDSIGRLEKEMEFRGDTGNQVYQQKFSYDRFGNRYLKAAENLPAQNPLLPTPLEESHLDKSTNQFNSTTGTIYDNAGNVATDTKYRGLKFYYDANGRVHRTSNTDDSNQSASIYNANGERIATQVNGLWKIVIYDIFGKIVSEYGGQPGTDEGGVKYIHQDRQGSTRTVTNVSGVAIARFDYQGFGEEIPSYIGQRTSSGYNSLESLRQKYALTERDEATGLDHTPWRKHENLAGRWTSPDPYNGSINLLNPQSFNRYSYVENDPINQIDPSGLWPWRVSYIDLSWTTPEDPYSGVHEVPDPLPEEFVTVTWEDDPLLEHETAISDAIDRANGVNEGEVDPEEPDASGTPSGPANSPKDDDEEMSPCAKAAFDRYKARVKKAQDDASKVNTNVTFGDSTTVIGFGFAGLVLGEGAPGAVLGTLAGFGAAKLGKIIDRDVPVFFAKYFDDKLLGDIKFCGPSRRRR